MGRSTRSYCRLGGVLLVATTLLGLTIGAILAGIPAYFGWQWFQKTSERGLT